MVLFDNRISLSGRAGEKGVAFTLVTAKDFEFAGHLVRSLEGVGQEVPKPLLDLAMQVITFHSIHCSVLIFYHIQSSWFRKSRFKGGQGKSMNTGGAGLGYRELSGFNNHTVSIM